MFDMDVSSVKIGFIGFGNMASAMADGWIASGKVAPKSLCACAGRLAPGVASDDSHR